MLPRAIQAASEAHGSRQWSVRKLRTKIILLKWITSSDLLTHAWCVPFMQLISENPVVSRAFAQGVTPNISFDNTLYASPNRDINELIDRALLTLYQTQDVVFKMNNIYNNQRAFKKRNSSVT